MTAEVIDGRKIAEKLKEEVAAEVAKLAADGTSCGLATVVIGDDYSSHAYGRRLSRIAAETGVAYRQVALAAASGQDEVLASVRELNGDPSVSGVVILRPLPDHVAEVAVFRAVSPAKDIESVHPENAGLLALGAPRYVPSTAAAVFHVLDTWLDQAGEERSAFYHRSLIVVVGRSNNVGKPAVSLAYDRQAAVESVDRWASRAAAGLAHPARRRPDRRGRSPRTDPRRARPRGSRRARRRHQPGARPADRGRPDGRRRRLRWRRSPGPCGHAGPWGHRPGYRRVAHP